MIIKRILILIFLLFSLTIYSDDLVTSSELNITLNADEGYGFIALSWELQGIPKYDKLELKILNRVENKEEVINITDKTSYVLDRGFRKDSNGNYKEISFWVVATIEKRKKLGVKYYKTWTNYIASVMITTAPLNFPPPQTPQYNRGKIFCKLILDKTDLIKRFYGFKVENKEYKRSYNPYGAYELQVNKQRQPSEISALFMAVDKPNFKQESQQIEISKTNKKFTSQKSGMNNDKISYISVSSDSADAADKYELAIEKQQTNNCISISWNKVEEAEYYFIYRTPAKDSLYRSFKANSLPASQSQRYNRLKFNNNYHVYSTFEKKKLKSRNVYTYWINAKKVNDDLGTSGKISIYYYNGSNGAFSQELKEAAIEQVTSEDNQKTTSNHKGISKALENKGYEKHVFDFFASEDSLEFIYNYIDLKPYRYLESGNDGYINIEDVVRAFLPKEYSNDKDLLALITIINYDAFAKKQSIENTKIITDGVIRIPIPRKLIEHRE